MAKRIVFVCDGAGCGAVLVNQDDGIVVYGSIKTTTCEGEPKVLVAATTGAATDPPGSTSAPETSLCKDCARKMLHL